jgi:hypothetical protein
MKHPKRQQHQRLNESVEQNNVSRNGTVTSMVGKGTFTLTFNLDVATALDLNHKETLRYEVSGNRLVISKSSE